MEPGKLDALADLLCGVFGLAAPHWVQSWTPRKDNPNHGPDGKFSGGPGGAAGTTAVADPARFHDSVRDKIAAGMAHLSDAKRESYRLAIHDVMGGLNEKARETVDKMVTAFKFYETNADLQQGHADVGGRPTPGKKVGGFWEVQPGQTSGPLHLNGGKDTGEQYKNDIRHTYAHEIGHALAGPEQLDRTPAWSKAWKEEIDTPNMSFPLSAHATLDQREGWAEMGRLILTGGEQTAASKFPKCYKVWQEAGLVGAGRKGNPDQARDPDGGLAGQEALDALKGS